MDLLKITGAMSPREGALKFKAYLHKINADLPKCECEEIGTSAQAFHHCTLSQHWHNIRPTMPLQTSC